eukprot:8207343-Pyramimonas_sp.AAC.1
MARELYSCIPAEGAACCFVIAFATSTRSRNILARISLFAAGPIHAPSSGRALQAEPQSDLAGTERTLPPEDYTTLG